MFGGMTRTRTRIAAVAAAGLALSAAAAGAVVAQDGSSDVKSVTAPLKSEAGADVGTVEFRKSPRSAVYVRVNLRGLPPGFHGFHLHTVGTCSPDFKAAMGHLRNPGESEADQKGAFPPLLVKKDGSAFSVFQTDRFNLEDLQDADGSAVMVHALPDNFANIPKRYAAAPDQETMDTGDSGARIACGTVPK